jgi:hypothetical protein
MKQYKIHLWPSDVNISGGGGQGKVPDLKNLEEYDLSITWIIVITVQTAWNNMLT